MPSKDTLSISCLYHFARPGCSVSAYFTAQILFYFPFISPLEPLLSFTCIYSGCFFLLYPIGIPVFMHLALRYMGVTDIVKRKLDHSKFSAMLALFSKRACSVECQRVARLVGNVDNHPEEFAAQTETEYNKLVKMQNDEQLDTIIVEKLRAKGRGLREVATVRSWSY